MSKRTQKTDSLPVDTAVPKQSVEERLAMVEKKLNYVAAKLRSYSDNWKTFAAAHLGGEANDGKIGNAPIRAILAVGGIALLCIASALFAETYDSELGAKDNWGVAVLRTNGNFLTDGSITAGGSLAGTAGGTGTATNNATAVDTDYGNVRKTLLTFASVPVTVSYAGIATNTCGGTKVYDFPEGRIYVLGVTVDSLTSATTATCVATSAVAYAMGTAVGTAGTLTGTQVDLCPTGAVTQLTNTYSSALASGAQFDGTTTAKDVYLNQYVLATNNLSGTTNLISGSATIHWINLGDY